MFVLVLTILFSPFFFYFPIVLQLVPQVFFLFPRFSSYPSVEGILSCIRTIFVSATISNLFVWVLSAFVSAASHYGSHACLVILTYAPVLKCLLLKVTSFNASAILSFIVNLIARFLSLVISTRR